MSDTDKPKALPSKPRKSAAKAVGKSVIEAAPDERKPAKRVSANSAQATTVLEETLPPASAPAGQGKRKPASDDARIKASSKPAVEPETASATGLPQGGLIRVPMPVRWRDLDAFNHVNNSKYLSYLEEARLQWMLGVPGQGMDDHVAPVVAAAQLNYRRPITWPAEVMIELFVERLGNSSLTVGHRIVDAQDADVLYCDGHVVLVWIDRDSGTSASLPASVREACRESA
jgi:acyl-CoA thioester hydrolase